MIDRLHFLYHRAGERLWIKPLCICLVSVLGAFAAKFFGDALFGIELPSITVESLETILEIMASSMLVIATFSVGAMVAAYGSASTTATPRSFPLIVSDDASQNALSTFVGAFIFSVVSIVALQNSYYSNGGRFVLFVVTVAVFVMVILTFIHWVDRIARLGRLGETVNKVEEATAAAMRNRLAAPTLCGVPVPDTPCEGLPVEGREAGYVQHIDVSALQAAAEDGAFRVRVACLPGSLYRVNCPLAYVRCDAESGPPPDLEELAKAFTIGRSRTFEQDPRFGLLALSEIASRALSPAVNDPGTAIAVTGSLLRLFTLWAEPLAEKKRKAIEADRVEVPELKEQEMVEDAFGAMARDGAGTIEVVIRLIKALQSLSALDHPALCEAAEAQAAQVRARAEQVLTFEGDRSRLDALRPEKE